MKTTLILTISCLGLSALGFALGSVSTGRSLSGHEGALAEYGPPNPGAPRGEYPGGTRLIEPLSEPLAVDYVA